MGNKSEFKRSATAMCKWCDYYGSHCRKGHLCPSYKRDAKKFFKERKRYNKKIEKEYYGRQNKTLFEKEKN